MKIAESAAYLWVDLVAGGSKKGQTPSHQHYCMKQEEVLNTEVSSTELLYKSVPHSQTTKRTAEKEIKFQVFM